MIRNSRKKWASLLGLVVLGSIACSEISPTALDHDLLPEAPVTVEVRIPWDEFGSGLASYGGFGLPDDLGIGVAAHALGALEARTLVRLGDVPTSASVRDTTGTSRTDTLLHVLGGRLVAVIDTLGSVAPGPVTLEVGMLQQEWDPTTADWTQAIDTTGVTVPWVEPGAGPVSNVITAVWDPAAGDSAFFELDSAMVATWADTSSTNQGLRLGVLTEGTRLEIGNVLLQVDVRPSLNPDTTLVVVANRQAMTFVYTPEIQPPTDEIRVGGTPSWRTVLDVQVPTSLSGPTALCASVGCPVELTAGRITYAALVLQTREVDPAFMPSDTVNLDIRPVFDRSVLPKAPLGNSLITTSLGRRIAPGLFGAGAGTEVEIPITAFVRSLLEPDTTAAFPPPNTLALLSTFEPISIAYADFFGPGSPQAPVLKLVVTVGPSVELP